MTDSQVRRDYGPDDMPARGVVIASIAGLLVWIILGATMVIWAVQ